MSGPLISLFTDASHDHELQLGGWGAWARSSEGRAYNGGMFPYPIKQTAEAELGAVLEGLKMCQRTGLIHAKGEYAQSIIIQSDNMQVVNWVNKRFHRKWDGEEKFPMLHPFMAEIQEILLGMNTTIKHIKGHAANTTNRNFVNNLCDKYAKQGLKKARATYARSLGKYKPKGPHLFDFTDNERAALSNHDLLVHPKDRVEMGSVMPQQVNREIGETQPKGVTQDFHRRHSKVSEFSIDEPRRDDPAPWIDFSDLDNPNH